MADLDVVDAVPVDTAEQAIDEFATAVKDGAKSHSFGFAFGGLVVGVLAGAAGGYLISRHLLETKYNKIAEDEIAEMREHYQNKLVALDNEAGKEELEDIVRERGYSTEPPMAVTPPTAVVDAVAEALEEEEPVDIPTVEEPPKSVNRNIFQDTRVVDNNWDYHKELARRSPVRPYVIHRDEREERPYIESTLTYYESDDVLCDERDEVIADIDRDRLIGENNLERFGHGSDDSSIVYIRNDKLEAQYEVVRSPNSYAEEVHGFEHTDSRAYRRRERQTYDDE